MREVRRRVFVSAALILAVLAAWFAIRTPEAADSRLRLVFTAQANGGELVFDRYLYENPGGAGQFLVRNFRFYVSNIRLSGKDGEYSEPDSYHLVRFDGQDGVFAVELDGIPLASYSSLAFSVGLDEEANASIEPRGDLDPNSQMAWNWEVGYKFVVLEGSLKTEDGKQPLVYHVGFSENRRDLEFGLPGKNTRGSERELRFNADVMALFAGASALDLAKLPSVKFDRGDARVLADNYSKMIALHED